MFYFMRILGAIYLERFIILSYMISFIVQAGIFSVLLAGVAGFEPAHGDIKNRCLTTWLHPNCVLIIFKNGFRVERPFCILFFGTFE